MSARLAFSPLTQEEIMARRALADQSAAMHLRFAVAQECVEHDDLFARLAREAAEEAVDYDAALVQRIGYSPVGMCQCRAAERATR